MKKILFLGLMVANILFCHAQNYVDLAKIYYQNTPQNDFDSISGSTSTQEFGADLILPIQLESGNAIITGLAYNNLSFGLDQANTVALQDIALKLGMSINHSDRLNATYMLLPKLASDFEKTGANDFQFGAVAIFKLKKNENFKYKAGLYYNAELFGTFFVPFVGCYYISKNEKLEVDLSLPIAADINYSLTDNFKVGFNYATSTKSFNLNKPYTLLRGSYDDTYVKKYSLEAFPYVRLALAESFLFYAKVGYSIGRAYEVSENDDENSLSILSIGFGDDPEVLNSTFKDGIIYRVGFRYRFNIKKEEGN